MNTKIARRLNEARRSDKPGKELDMVGEEITRSHNNAVANGFLDLPVLELIGMGYNELTNIVLVTPKSGMIELSDLYNLKTAWGADKVNVLTADKSIELVFNK